MGSLIAIETFQGSHVMGLFVLFIFHILWYVGSLPGFGVARFNQNNNNNKTKTLLNLNFR